MTTEDGIKCGESVQMCEEAPHVKRKRSNWRVSSVLGKHLSAEPQVVRAIVATVKEKRFLSMIMKEITKCLPVLEFGHLKRIRGCDVILCGVEKFPEITDEANVRSYLEQKGLSGTLVEKLCEIRQESVPRDAPTLRWQFDLASKYWPCKFHPDKHLELLYNNEMFSNHQVNFHINIMEMCLELSDKLTNPAIVVDPRGGQIVTVAWSEIQRHPLRHTPMVAIDNVARSQDGGAWMCEDVTETLNSVRSRFKGVTCDGGDCGNLTKYGPYLCTGYDVYVLEEPCLMCSMALIHSRVRRVFFQRQSSSGALMSAVQLHTVKELNHHYQVFRID